MFEVIITSPQDLGQGVFSLKRLENESLPPEVQCCCQDQIRRNVSPKYVLRTYDHPVTTFSQMHSLDVDIMSPSEQNRSTKFYSRKTRRSRPVGGTLGHMYNIKKTGWSAWISATAHLRDGDMEQVSYTQSWIWLFFAGPLPLTSATQRFAYVYISKVRCDEETQLPRMVETGEEDLEGKPGP